MIQHYEFGKIIIDGKTYTHDVKIKKDKIEDWWREEGHVCSINDIKDCVDEKPDVIIIGTGHDGVMKVPEDTIEFLKDNNIEFVIDTTGNAVKRFNELEGKNIIGAFHLTC